MVSLPSLREWLTPFPADYRSAYGPPSFNKKRLILHIKEGSQGRKPTASAENLGSLAP